MKNKHMKYDNVINTDKYIFVPFVIEITGTLDTETFKILKRLEKIKLQLNATIIELIMTMWRASIQHSMTAICVKWAAYMVNMRRSREPETLNPIFFENRIEVAHQLISN